MSFRFISCRRLIALFGIASSVLLCGISSAAQAQSGAAASAQAAPPPGIPLTSGPVLPLFRELRSVAIDPKRVYHIREASLDREDVHLSLNDGTIGFLETVDGRVTGAYFEGDGEVLIRPPDRMERASLGLFTGEGVLEEQFTSAYLRFNDTSAEELSQYLRPAEGAAEFVQRNDQAARNLATMDAMRLCISFTSVGEEPAPGVPAKEADRFLHARVAGEHYGVFDVYFDTRAPEQIMVGKTSNRGNDVYYDLWMSFLMQSVRNAGPSHARFQGPTGPAFTREALFITKYKLDTTLEPPHELSASATLSCQVRRGGSRLVLFELSRYLQLSRVEYEGKPLEYIQNESVPGSELERRGNDSVAVVFPEPLHDGASFELRLTYAGSVLSDAGNGLLYVGARGTWYPNRGILMARYDETFRFPLGWTLVATGTRVSLQSEGGNYVGHWIAEKPIPIAGFNMGRYVESSAKAGEIPVDVFSARGVEHDIGKASVNVFSSQTPSLQPPTGAQLRTEPAPVPSREGSEMAQNAAKVLLDLQQMLGPYSFSSLAVTQRPGLDSQGWPGLIFLSSYAYLTPEQLDELKVAPVDKIMYRHVMMPHEVAHQWFGDEVSWASYHEQWLMEALSNYVSLMLLERTRPVDAEAILQAYRQTLAAGPKGGPPNNDAGPVSLGVRLSSSKFPAGYEIITYARGTWLIHMLREMLRDASRSPENPAGDDKLFLLLLRNLVAQYQSKEITNADFERAVEAVLPPSLWFENHKSLDWFFDGWVNGTAFPKLQLRDVKFSARATAISVSGTLRQNSAPDDLITSVPIYGLAGEQKIYLGRIFAEGDETHFSLKVPPQVKRIAVDPYNTVLTGPQ